MEFICPLLRRVGRAVRGRQNEVTGARGNITESPLEAVEHFRDDSMLSVSRRNSDVVQ
jgi:hypothetical protein